jgi:hypothetical protein
MVQDGAMPKREPPKREPPAASDPNQLVRQEGGGYRSADERFDVQGSAGRWFATDQQQTDELGQPLIHGPYATLDELKEALADARRPQAKGAPRLRVIGGSREASRSAEAPEPRRGGDRRTSAAQSQPAAPPQRSWIDALPAADARRVRTLIRAVEREGVDKAEALVRRDRDGLHPAVAAELIARRLEAIVAGLPAAERKVARATIERVIEILAVEGSRIAPPLPRWLLVEVGPESEPRNRRISPTIR